MSMILKSAAATQAMGAIGGALRHLLEHFFRNLEQPLKISARDLILEHVV